MIRKTDLDLLFHKAAMRLNEKDNISSSVAIPNSYIIKLLLIVISDVNIAIWGNAQTTRKWMRLFFCKY